MSSGEGHLPVSARGGPLAGLRVVELGALGPAPFCGMVLSDMGADVVRIERPAAVTEPALSGLLDPSLLSRGRRRAAIDLKHPDGLAAALAVVERADALIEGFRPGVAERLGIGPDPCCSRNPRLVYGRVTGWGQDGPMAPVAGHDLNYLSLAGGLHPIGAAEAGPVPPLNLVADFGGGAMILAVGVLAALVESKGTGRGQVVDASMLDGSAYLMTMMYELLAKGGWTEERGANANDGGAPFYRTYETRDHQYVAVAALEPQFYANLVDGLGLDAEDLPPQWDRSSWPLLHDRFAAAFRRRSRDEWADRLTKADTCVTAVLRMSEAIRHDHNQARQLFVDVGGVLEPAPAPRFSRTPGRAGAPPARPGAHTAEVLLESGLTDADVDHLERAGAIVRAPATDAASGSSPPR